MCVRKQSILASINEDVELNDIHQSPRLSSNKRRSGIHRQLVGYMLPICNECNSTPLLTNQLNRCCNLWFRNLVCNIIPNGFNCELCTICLDPIQSTTSLCGKNEFIETKKDTVDDDPLNKFEQDSMQNC